jgi:hypothetical protein
LHDGPSTTFTISVAGITEPEAVGLHKFCTIIAIARKRQANHHSHNAIVLHVCHEQPAQNNALAHLASFCESAAADAIGQAVKAWDPPAAETKPAARAAGEG